MSVRLAHGQGKGITQAREYQEVGVVGAVLEAAHYTFIVIELLSFLVLIFQLF